MPTRINNRSDALNVLFRAVSNPFEKIKEGAKEDALKKEVASNLKPGGESFLDTTRDTVANAVYGIKPQDIIGEQAKELFATPPPPEKGLILKPGMEIKDLGIYPKGFVPMTIPPSSLPQQNSIGSALPMDSNPQGLLMALKAALAPRMGVGLNSIGSIPVGAPQANVPQPIPSTRIRKIKMPKIKIKKMKRGH